MRRREELVTGNGKSKMTVMMFQLEGGDETLRDGIRSITQTVSAVLNAPRVAVPKLSMNLPAQEVNEPQAVEPEIDEPSDAPKDVSEPTSRRSVSGVAKVRSPKILDLDLKSPKPGLKEFCEGKSVGDNDSRRYIVIAFWLKEKLQISAVTMDHIHTCYRFLGWQTPTDASSPLRGMKAKGWFSKGTEKGSYAINHVGENVVMGINGAGSHEA